MTTEHQDWLLQLNEGDAEARALAAENLSYLGADAAFATVDLVQACAGEEVIREWAIAALEEIRNPPAETSEALAVLTQSEDPPVAYWAVTLLGRLGPIAQKAETQLTSLLRNPIADLAVRERAAWAIGQIGPAARDAVPELEKLLDSDHPRLARLAKNALSQVQAE